MGFEIKDRRAEKAAAEAATPVKPTALDVVKDRMDRAVGAMLNGDDEALAAVTAECSSPPKTYGDVVPFKKTVRGEVQSWKSVGYLLAFIPMGQAQPLLVLRAVGLRSDELMYIADYALPPIWEAGEDFATEALKRLNTFMCSCDRNGRCKFHGEALPSQRGPGKWMEEDSKRLAKVQSQVLPEAIELLMKAEAARAQNRIVVPGGRVQ